VLPHALVEATLRGAAEGTRPDSDEVTTLTGRRRSSG